MNPPPVSRQPEGVLVCFALAEEAAPFRRLAARLRHVRVLVTGMGRQNAERALRAALAEARPACVLTCGYAGGLNPELKVGQVVFSAEGSSSLGRQLRTTGAREARFHCADRVASTAAEKRRLRQTTGADAVEMESEVIRQICGQEGIASATVRAISDAAEEDLPLDFNRLMTADRKLDRTKLALAIARSPSCASGLLRLRRQTRQAARELARVLEEVLTNLA